MKTTFFVLAATAAAGTSAQNLAYNTTGGTGPYRSYWFEDSTLPKFTIYQPKDPSKIGTKIPVIAWANGGCSTEGLASASFLAQVASHGAMCIAVGALNAPANNPGSQTGGKVQLQAIDWVIENAGKGNYTHLDPTRIAVWGLSCGGVESYSDWADSRVSSIGIFSSGLMSEADSKATAPKITKPIFYFLGGSTDVAYTNGERDYGLLPSGTPSWKGNDNLGHGTPFYTLLDAGHTGIAGSRFMQWVLRGNATAGKWFTDGSALTAGYKDVKYKSLDNIKVTPIA